MKITCLRLGTALAAATLSFTSTAADAEDAKPTLRGSVSAAIAKDDAGSAPYPQYRGVNVGGWLVLESWMYPDWWKTTGVPIWKGEKQFVGILGEENARPLLEEHWDTWVTEDDFKRLSEAGIKHLRIPVGYWILGEEWLKPGETYMPGGWRYLIRGLEWAKIYGLEAIIDLHAAPGVQNGHDNGGDSDGPIQWNQWENLQRTTDVLVALAKNLTTVNETDSTQGTVLGLCILNEPWTQSVGGPLSLQTVKDWSQSAIDAIFATGWKGHIWYPDGFALDWGGWHGFMTGPQYPNVFADTHIYMLFDPNLQNQDANGQAHEMCYGHYANQLNNAWGVSQGVVVGEYSLDYTHYPSYPYDDWTKQSLQSLLLAEQKLFGVIGPRDNAAVGGFFWSFKSYGRVNDNRNNLYDNHHSPWNYLDLIADGIASNLSTASYQCHW